MLDYLPPMVAFVAAVGAILGAPKWDAQGSGLAKITPLGWVVLGVGLAALISSFLLVKRNHREQSAQKAVKSQIAEVGQDQLLLGLDRMVCVFRCSSHWHAKVEEPKSPIDLLTAERRMALSALDLNSFSPYADGKDYVKWWEMFENTAKLGATQITTALQTYVTFLDPKVIEAATELLNCEFQHRLLHIHDIIDANMRGDPNRSVRFFWVAPDDRHDSGYSEYWTKVARLISLCTPDSGLDRVTWGNAKQNREG